MSGQYDNRPATFESDASSSDLIVSFENSQRIVIAQNTVVGVKPNDDDSLTITTVEKRNANSDGGTPDAPISPQLKTIKARGLPDSFIQAFKAPSQRLRQSDHLQDFSIVPTTHVIISTLSGTGQAQAFYDSLLKPFLNTFELREHKDYVVHQTKSDKTIGQLTKSLFLPQANYGIVQRIILLAGDGGTVDLLNALHSDSHTPAYRAPVLSLLPLGTGNALAHSTGITNDETWGMATLARGVPRDLPMFRAEFSQGARLVVNEGDGEEDIPLKKSDGTPIIFGAVVCSWGLHAGLVADSDTTEYRKHGADRFKMAAMNALNPSDGSHPHTYQAQLSFLRAVGDGQGEWQPLSRTRHSYVLATIVSQLEKGYTISPASEPFDGRLRVVHIDAFNDGKEAMRVLNLPYSEGKHIEEAVVEYEDVEGVRIDFKGLETDGRWRRVCVDGKIIRVEADGWVTVQKERSKLVQLTHLQ